MNQQQLVNTLGLTGIVMVVVAQPVQADTVKVSAVEINPTSQGIDIVLTTADSKRLQVSTSGFDNTFVANILNSQLQLADGNSFRREKPIEGIDYVTVTSLNANSIRIVVTGKTGLPKPIVTQSDRGLVLSLTAPTNTTATKPAPTPAIPDTAQPIDRDPQSPQTQPTQPTAPAAQEPQSQAEDR